MLHLLIGTSTKALFKGIETWKKESIMKKVSPVNLTFYYVFLFLFDSLIPSSQEAAKLLGSSSKLIGKSCSITVMKITQ